MVRILSRVIFDVRLTRKNPVIQHFLNNQRNYQISGDDVL